MVKRKDIKEKGSMKIEKTDITIKEKTQEKIGTIKRIKNAHEDMIEKIPIKTGMIEKRRRIPEEKLIGDTMMVRNLTLSFICLKIYKR